MDLVRTGTSVVALPSRSNEAASLAEHLFAVEVARLKPQPAQRVMCQERHCHETAFFLVNDHIVIHDRHHSERHTSVISLEALGYVKKDG